MATKSKSFLGKLFDFIITLVIIVAVIVIIIGVQPIARVGDWAKNIKIGGVDLSEFGGLTAESEIPYLSGVKFSDLDMDPQSTTVFEFFKMVYSLMDGLKVNESDIVATPVAEEDTTAVKGTVDSVLPDSGESKDYVSLLGDQPVTTTTESQLSFSGNQLAALFNLMIEQAGTGDGAAAQLKNLDAQISTIVFSDSDGEKVATMVLSIDIKDIKAQLSASLPSFITDKLGDTLYLTCVESLSVSAEGVLGYTTKSVVLNKYDKVYSDMILSAVGGALGLSADGQTTEQYLGESVGAAFCKVINNLGRVGTLVSSSYVASDTINVTDGTITVVTRAAD